MLGRTDLRINFASLRASEGVTVPYALTRLGKLRGATIKVLGKALSSRLRQLSLGIIFVILRPFDVIPMIWYRFFGSLLVRIRETLSIPFQQTGTAAQSS
jgi:hypothetical protein